MKKLAATMTGLAVAGGVVMGSGVALADGMDRARKAPPPVAVAPVYTWGGLYVGAHVGGVWGDVDLTALRSPLSGPSDIEQDVAALPDGTRISHEIDGFIGGGQIGIQHQWGRWVLGVEASLSGGDDLKDKSSFRSEAEFLGGAITFEDRADVRTEMDWLILATARLGYTWDRWMLYAKGGYASARIKTSGDRHAELDLGGIIGIDEIERKESFRSSERHHGWTIGAGVEYMLTPNVTLGVEYNYIDLEAKRHSGVTNLTTTIEPVVGPTVTDRDLRAFALNVDPDVMHTVWARLNFKLSREVPVEPLK